MSNAGILVGSNVFWIEQVLMIAGRRMGAPHHLETIEEMDRDLTRVIEDFMPAVNVEALRRAKENGKHSLFLSTDSPFSLVS